MADETPTQVEETNPFEGLPRIQRRVEEHYEAVHGWRDRCEGSILILADELGVGEEMAVIWSRGPSWRPKLRDGLKLLAKGLDEAMGNKSPKPKLTKEQVAAKKQAAVDKKAMAAKLEAEKAAAESTLESTPESKPVPKKTSSKKAVKK